MLPIIQDKESIIKQICLELEEILNEKSLLIGDKRQNIFNKIKYLHGFIGQYPFKCEINNIKVEDILSIESLNQLDPIDRDKIIESLLRSLRTRLFATEFQAEELTLDLKNYTFHYHVFNDFFKDPKPYYAIFDLEELLTDLNEKKLFDFNTNPITGLIETSNTINSNMHWQWLTDSCMAGLWQKENDPFSWRKSMIVNAAVMNTNEINTAIAHISKDPDWYRKAQEDKESLDRGIYHIFNPRSIRINALGSPIVKEIELGKWIHPRRVESQALLLLNILETIEAGIHHEAWGFNYTKDFNEQNREIIFKAIYNLLTFLMSINWNTKHNMYDANAPTSSSWEEIIFWEGASLDTAYTYLALDKFCKLVFSENYGRTNAIIDLKNTLNNLIVNCNAYADCLNESQVRMLMQACNSKIYDWVVKPILYDRTQPIHSPENKIDTSLVLLASSNYRFSEDVILDTEIRKSIVDLCDNLLADDYGMRRYNKFTREDIVTGTYVKIFDSYLNINSQIINEVTPIAQVMVGQKADIVQLVPKHSSTTEFLKRQKLAKADFSAQWSIGTTASLKALAKSKINLISQSKSIKYLSPQVENLIKEIDIKIAHYINKTLALVAGFKDKDMIRADGNKLGRSYSILEAYQAVTDLTGKTKWLPGAHTLSWSAAQFYSGLKLALKAEHELRSFNDYN
jgi:hypothetical protein